MNLRMDRIPAAAAIFVCLCVIVSAKNIENVRSKRTISNNCENVKAFFHNLNVSINVERNRGSVCGGECCGDPTEMLLRKQGQKDFASLLRHNSRSVQGLLSFTAATLQTHVSELSRQSENKTLLLFSQVYKGMAVLSRAPITTLYAEIRSYLAANTTRGPADIKRSISQFFTDFFPLVYHHILLNHNNKRDFAPDYKACLKKTMEIVLPFGDIPSQISSSLSKSLEATRLLLQAFRIGTEVLSTTDELLIDENGKNNGECHDALLKMTYCPKCMGLAKHAKPCAGYCLNVLRGCLTKYVAELDAPWNGYVDGIESLVNAIKRNGGEGGINVEGVIKLLDTRISEAIMHAMEKGQDIDNKIKRNCGAAIFSAGEDPLLAEAITALPGAASKPRQANPRVFNDPPEAQLAHFLISIAKTRGFYGNLADTLCQDESFAEPKDQRCWNGERIAEYTKTVMDVGLNMQRYNPEVKPMANTQAVDPRITDLVVKLHHVHRMALSSLGSNSAEVDYMQRDGVDGSGSGNGPSDFEGDTDEEYPKGSGSGDGPNIEDGTGRGNQPDRETEGRKVPPASTPTGGAGAPYASVLMLLGLVLLARLPQ